MNKKRLLAIIMTVILIVGLLPLGVFAESDTQDELVSIENAKVTAEDREYNGTEHKPEPTVTLNGTTLTKGTDYDASYTDNKYAGDATVTVTGKGNYTGTAKGTFKIAKRPVTVTVSDKTLTYNGEVQAGKTGYVFGNLLMGHLATISYVPASGKNASSAAYDNGVFVVYTFRVVDGEVDITANYTLTAASAGKLTIEPKAAVITVDDAYKTEGGDDPVFTGTVEGLIADGDLGEITYSRTGSDKAPGTYKGVLTAAYTDNPNYNVTVTKGDFTIKKAYDVVWIDGNGFELDRKPWVEGETEPTTDKKATKDADAQFTYTFSKWNDGEWDTAHTVKTYKPQFNKTINKYKVTFVDEDGTTVLKEATEYDYGTPAADIDVPADPKKDADAQYTYTFAGWEPEIADVTADATYTATYTKTEKEKERPTYKAVSGSGGTYTKVSGKTLSFTIKRSTEDETTFSHFTGIEVDGKAVPEKDASGNANWTAKSGSVIIELQSSYLETLSVGEHKLAVQFDDGADATSTFTVKAKPATPTVTPTKTPTKAATTSGKAATTAPKTGDASNMLLWFLLICASLFVMFRIISLRNRRFYDR